MGRQRAALSMLWKDRCRVAVRREETDPVTMLTDFREVVILEDEPCKLSFKLPFGRLSSTGDGSAARVSQVVRLFLAPEPVIPPGSKVTVTHRGRVTDYAQSSQPSVFSGHQELNLTLFQGWA